MKELGSDSDNEHKAIIDFLDNLFKADFPIKQAIVVGEEFGRLHSGTPENILFFPDTPALKTWFDEQDFHHHHLLVKGSRSIGLEGLLDN